MTIETVAGEPKITSSNDAKVEPKEFGNLVDVPLTVSTRAGKIWIEPKPKTLKASSRANAQPILFMATFSSLSSQLFPTKATSPFNHVDPLNSRAIV
jgi:hypothetical protein